MISNKNKVLSRVRGLALGGILLLTSVLEGTAELPQRSEFQRILRDYLGTFQASDFELPEGEFAVDEAYLENEDDLFKTWLVLTERYGRFAEGMFNISSEDFTLEKIESPEGVRLRARKDLYPASLLWFAEWDYPGNPYYQSRTLRNRVLAFCIVDMLNLDALHIRDTPDAKPVKRADFLGGSLIWHAMVYSALKNEMPPEVRRAYETALNRFVDRLIQWEPGGGLGNMDCMGLVAMAYIAHSVDDPALASKAKEFAKMITDKVVAPAGYVTDGGGTDISYNGLALYHLAWAARMTDWDFLNEATLKVLKFYNAMILRDPDGSLWGPSHFSSRTSADAASDQWAFVHRQYGLALNWPEQAGYLLYEGNRAPKVPDESAMHKVVIKELAALNSQRKAGREKMRNPTLWGEEHFDARYNWAWKYYKTGEYAKLRKALEERPKWTEVPLSREENLKENLANELIVRRSEQYASLLHTGKIGRYENFIYGLGGGTLSAFWTPETGSVFLSRRRGHQHDNPDTLEEWRTWPVHALSGLSRDGKLFTSARVRYPQVTVSSEGNDEVTIVGKIGDELSAPDNSLKAPIGYERRFKFDDGGVEYATKVSGDGLAEVSELYEIFPIFLRDERMQRDVSTEIFFVVNGKEIEATTAPVDGVEAVRIRRFHGVVEMRFEEPRRVRLSPEVWNDTYQSRVQQRNIMIDMQNKPELKCRISKLDAESSRS